MAYTTGSGTWATMMASVLSHALADGWTESGGLATGWPIEINGKTYIDQGVQTMTIDDDWTTGVNTGRVPRDVGIITLGTSAADATAKIGVNQAYMTGRVADETTIVGMNASAVAGADKTFSNYWIFSDPASGTDYIHVVYQMSNGINDDCYQWFSFGEIDQGDFTHGGISYTSSRYGRPYAETTASGTTATDWNSVTAGCYPCAGGVGYLDWGFSSTYFILHATSPVNATNGYPAAGVVHRAYLNAWDCSRSGISGGIGAMNWNNNNSWRPFWANTRTNQIPFSGGISMSPIALILPNGTGTGNSITWVGEFPGYRQARMINFNPADVVEYSTDDWMIFPWLRQTDEALLADAYEITSGQHAHVIKKVP